MSMMLLISVSLLSWAQASTYEHRSKSLLSCDGETSDTIIMAQERFRGRVHFDSVNKMTDIALVTRAGDCLFHLVNPLAYKYLFINAFQRNVFYIYASSTVP